MASTSYLLCRTIFSKASHGKSARRCSISGRSCMKIQNNQSLGNVWKSLAREYNLQSIHSRYDISNGFCGGRLSRFVLGQRCSMKHKIHSLQWLPTNDECLDSVLVDCPS